MANTVANVTTGKPKVGGAVFWAPLGTTLPTDAVTALDDAFVCLGYCSEDGLKKSAAPDTGDIKAWGGDVVGHTNNGRTDTFQMTLLESMNPDVLKRVYNSENVSGTLEEGIAVKVNSNDPEEGVWVVDAIFKGGVLHRDVIPDGSVTDLDEINYNDGDPVGYGVTISCSPDASGNSHYEYTKKGAA